MALKIIKGTETIPVDHPIFMIFGEPGICKSSLGYSMKDPLTLDFDHGAHRAVNRRDTLLINGWPDVVELNDEALEPYGSIVVDTVGRCLEFITADIARTDAKKAPGGTLTMQGWGVLKTRFASWTSSIRSYGKDLLFISHEKEDKDGELRIMRPDIAGGSYGEVMKSADFIGRVYMIGKDRFLDFNPTDRWVGKNPGAWEPFKIPPAGKATDFMAELVDRGRSVLGKISEASAVAANSVIDWRTMIGDFKTAADFNATIPKVKDIASKIIQDQVIKLLFDAADAKKITFDQEKKVFSDPVQTKQEPPVTAGRLL
jgi:hypothetical protein